MTRPTISFCTYTFNDAEFTADLIRQTRMFSMRPDEIVVVDDGSDTPFVMDDAPANLRVLRFEKNRGITAAKGAGLSAASGDFIFSMDCDTRVSTTWLERNLPHASVPEIGLVGGSLVYRSGDDLVSRYLSVFGDNHNQHHVGAVDFIPGNAFLLRREIWEQAGGFDGYGETNCQDHYLCGRLKDLGYTLFSDARAEAWQLRRITRTTMCKRVWKWCHKPIKRQACEADDIVNYLFGTFVAPMLDRCDNSAVLGEPLFYYLELLYLAHAVLDTLDHLVAQGRMSAQKHGGFLAELVELFAGYPRIQAMYRADLYAMGHDMLASVPSGDTAAWREFFMFAPMMQKGGLFTWLEEQGVAQLVRDEVEAEYDFSSYAEATYEVVNA